MREPVSPPQRFVADLKARWRFLAACCATALVLAAVVSALQPKRYTATAQLLIEPPGGTDPRVLTAVSPVYLESLKAYERLASSDSLFLRAIEHVNGTDAHEGRSIESLKRSILRVAKPTNTAILEISATMTDPRKAQALAQFIAEQTVAMGNSIDNEAEQHLIGESRKQVDEARERLARLEADQRDTGRDTPKESLEAEVDNDVQLLRTLDAELSKTRTEASAITADDTRARASAEARIKSLSEQRAELLARLRPAEKRLHDLTARTDAITAQQQAAAEALETADEHLNTLLASDANRGERLKLIDKGIIPQEPRSPNVPLNLLVALVLSAIAGCVYVALTPDAKRIDVPDRAIAESALTFRR